jgi:hypothetical protein
MATTYYADNVVAMPIAALWRASLSAAPLFCLPLFLYFLFRKMVGWRFPAHYGIASPVAHEELRAAEIPREVHEAYARYTDAVFHAGCRFLFFLRSHFIGAREGYSAVYLHESGLVWVALAWIHFWIGSRDRSRVVFACHSRRRSGIRLHTGPVPEESRLPQLVPPMDEMLYLPMHTSTEEVIAEHLCRLKGEKDLVRFDAETLRQELVQSAQDIIDFQVSKGYYIELTAAEVNRLIPDKYGE